MPGGSSSRAYRPSGQQQREGHLECRRRSPHAAAHAGLVGESVEAGQLSRVDQQLAGAGDEDAEHHGEGHRCIEGEEPLAPGEVAHLEYGQRPAVRERDAREQDHRADKHDHALHDVRADHRQKAAGGGVEHRDDEHDDDRGAVGNR